MGNAPALQVVEKEWGAGGSSPCRVWAEPTNLAPQRFSASTASTVGARCATLIKKYGFIDSLKRRRRIPWGTLLRFLLWLCWVGTGEDPWETVWIPDERTASCIVRFRVRLQRGEKGSALSQDIACITLPICCGISQVSSDHRDRYRISPPNAAI